MRPNRWLHAIAALSLCLASRAAAQNPSPETDWRTPPSRMLVVAPLTAFPDPIAVSMAVNARRTFTGEAGVALVAPGAFVRAGVYLPFRAGSSNGHDLLAYVGYRGIVLPLIEPVHGPTFGVGLRSWPRGGGWGFQVTTGIWQINRRLTCSSVCPNGDGIYLPEVRLAATRHR